MRGITAILLVAVQLLSASPVLAADPDDGPTVFGYPSAQEEATTEGFGGICTILAEIRKNNATSLGARGFQDCEGGLISNQTLELYVDRCTSEFPPGSGNCITWTQFLFLRRCSVNRGGSFWCPASGAFLNVNGVGQGQYKARSMGTVTSNIGNGSGSDESPSIFLP